MPSNDIDRNLLFGFLAFQNDFIARDELIAAVHVWMTDKSRSLEEILRQRKAMAEDEHLLISALVGKYLQRSADDVQKSLATLSSIGQLRDELMKLGDVDVAATLAHVSPSHSKSDTFKTVPHQDSFSGDSSSGDSLLRSSRFRIIRPHAEGGIGRVFVAHDEELNREVALKEIKSLRSYDPDSRSRFVLEAEITGGLEHPGIVPVYGLGQYADGRPYYAMRFIRGDSLAEAVDQFHLRKADRNAYGSVEFRKLLGRFIDVCNAIEYAHSRGVLHRDLKPGNIMLGKYGETLVVDWGLAKVKGRDHQHQSPGEHTLQPRSSSSSSGTIMGSAIGTPAFMSPEQAAGQLDQLGPPTDVYSLGATLYYILTGQPPIDKGDTIGTVIKKVQAGIFPPPRSINQNIPMALEAICLKAMQRESQDRYASPLRLADEVDRFLAEEKVDAHNESVLIRTRRWFRKHPRSVAAALTLLIVGIASAATISGIVGQKNLQLAQANKSLNDANAAQLATTVKLLEHAPAEAVPTLLEGMESVRKEIEPILESHWKMSERPDSQRIRLALALLPSNKSVAEYLQSQLLVAPPVDSIMIRDALKSQSNDLALSIWQSLESTNVPPHQHLRAAAALAAFDPLSPRWKEIARPTVAAMLDANPSDWGVWIDALRPVRERLLPALAEKFRDPAAAEQRNVSAVVIAEYAANQPEILADLAADAEPRQMAILLPRLMKLVDSVAPLLERELTRSCVPEWEVMQVSVTVNQLDNDTVKLLEQSEGFVTDAFAFCATLPRANFNAVHEAMTVAGYRLDRLRPYAAPNSAQINSVQIAAIWLRDGRVGEHLIDASPVETSDRDAALRIKGFLPVDVTGYLEPIGDTRKSVERYAAVWRQSREGEKEIDRKLVVGDAKEPQVEGVSYLSLQEFLGANGKPKYSTLGEKVEHFTLPIWNRDTASYVNFVRRSANFVQHDVCLSISSNSDAILRKMTGLLTQTDDKDFHYQYAAPFGSLLEAVSTELHGLDPAEHTKRSRELAEEGWRPSAISVCASLKKPTVVASVWQHPLITDDHKEKLARRQAHAAVALLLLGKPDKAWLLFQHTAEPRARSWLIHLIAQFSVPHQIIVDRTSVEANTSAQRALWLAVGELAEQFDEATRVNLSTQLEKIYREHPDTGVHAAAEWTLRRLHCDDAIDASDRELAAIAPSSNRSWYVNQRGHTMAVFHGPVQFVQGSPKGEPEQDPFAETPMQMRIGRSFAVATKEVSLEQFVQFASDTDYPKLSYLGWQKYTRDPECPISAVTWFDAAKYCRWVSEKEGIPEEEMCYPPLHQIKDGMKLPANYLQRTGYRLPTEAEWEFTCRAGANTSRCYGGSEELLGKYSRYVQNSSDRTWPRGRLKPNDFGMFDMHGNIWEWCQEGVIEPPSIRPEVFEDREDTNLKVTGSTLRMLRGGSFDRNASQIRSASRLGLPATDTYVIVGIRVARTMPDATQ